MSPADRERFRAALLQQLGGQACTDRTDTKDSAHPGIWLPLPAWEALADTVSQNGLSDSRALRINRTTNP